MPQWIKDAWSSMPPNQRWVLVVVGGVVGGVVGVVAIVWGVWPQWLGM